MISAFILPTVILPAKSSAEGISGYLEYVYTSTRSDTRDAAGATTKSDTGNIVQRYNLTLDKRVYPNLRVLSGGLFEKSDVDGSVDSGTSTQEFNSSATKIRPFVDISLSTPLYQASAAYSRSEDKQKSQGSPPLLLFRDQYSGSFGWTPDGFPSFRMQYLRSDNHDGERVLQDISTQTYQVTSNYRPVNPLNLYYQGSFTDTVDSLRNNEILDQSHNGRFAYSDHLWNRRIALGSDYSVTYRETETRAGGGGEVSIPLLPLQGLSSIDDTPDQGALSANPAIVDADLLAGSGINIGLPPPGGDTQRRNLGLDFAVATRLNTIFVWIDRELPRTVSDSFTWDVYTSSDNLNWVLRQSVASAPLDPFVPRFEIRFADVSSRFIKVVTRPLSPTVPLATDFPLIQVTELQASLRSPAVDVEGRKVSASHIYNLTVRTRMLDKPILNHELSYSLAKATGAPSRWILSNGLFAGHQVTRTVSASARFSREDAEDAGVRRTGYVFSGSVEAVPLPTLRHNLLLSGRTDTSEGKSSRNIALFLYNSAAIYKGIDANVALGRSRSVAENGQTTDTIQTDIGTSIVPNRKVNLGFTFSDRQDSISGGDTSAERTVAARSIEGNIAIYPVNTVYFTGSYRIEEPAGQSRRNIKNYSASWTPFPDGKLHLSFLYSETLSSETNGKDRVISPSLRLDLARGSFLSLAYQHTSSSSNLQTSDSSIFSGDLRIAF